MSWTKDKPVETGWYWWRKTMKQSSHMWMPYFVDCDDGETSYWELGAEVHPPEGGWWAGKIQEPVE